MTVTRLKSGRTIFSSGEETRVRDTIYSEHTHFSDPTNSNKGRLCFAETFRQSVRDCCDQGIVQTLWTNDGHVHEVVTFFIKKAPRIQLDAQG